MEKSYSAILQGFQNRLDLYSSFYKVWDAKKRENPELGKDRTYYDEFLLDYEKNNNNILTFKFSEMSAKQTCVSHGEFLVGLFLEYLGIAFQTEVSKDFILPDTNESFLDSDHYNVSEFDFYIPKLKLIIEVESFRYHVASICNKPEKCKPIIDEDQLMRPPPKNVRNFIEGYYGKHNFAQAMKINLIRIYAPDFLDFEDERHIIKINAVHNFIIEYINPFCLQVNAKEIIINMNDIIRLYNREFGTLIESKIKRINTIKGFGFIESKKPGMKDYFFHFKNLRCSPDDLKIGLMVTFNSDVKEKGPYAYNICPKK